MSASPLQQHERLTSIQSPPRIGGATPHRLALKRQSGSHRTLSREGWTDFVFAFHADVEVGPRMLVRIAKNSGLTPDDL